MVSVTAATNSISIIRLVIALFFFLSTTTTTTTVLAANTTSREHTRRRKRNEGILLPLPLLPPPPPPTIEIDCAVRRYAYQFAIKKISSSSWVLSNDDDDDEQQCLRQRLRQLQHVKDALRLNECTPKESNESESSSSSSSSSSIKQKRLLKSRPRRRQRQQSQIHDDDDDDDEEEEEEEEESNNNNNNIKDDRNTIYVDPIRGHESASGKMDDPFRTIDSAILASRRIRHMTTTTITTTTITNANATSTTSTTSTTTRNKRRKFLIILRGGTYYLKQTIQLDSRDSYLIIKSYPNEIPIISGGDLLSLGLKPTMSGSKIYSTKLPPRPPPPPPHDDNDHRTIYNFTTLFVRRPDMNDNDNDNDNDIDTDTDININDNDNDNDNDNNDIRLIWAREPNGNIEYNIQPDGYAIANGIGTTNTSSNKNRNKVWPNSSGSIHFVIKDQSRNSTIYPWYGEDLDPRGGGNWLHYGGTGNRFIDGKGFWNGTVPLSLKYHSEGNDNDGRSILNNTSSWTIDGYEQTAIIHIYHNAYWGNWQFKIDSIDSNTNQITFKEGIGGWQEGRGGGISNQPFYVEGIKEALDTPGEWWLDVPKQILYYYPFGNETIITGVDDSDDEIRIDFVAPKLKRLIEVMGSRNGNEDDDDDDDNGIAKNITISGITFTQTETTFMDQYEVPSPGDWSIRRDGTIFIENTENILIANCKLIRTGGNGIFLSGHAKQTNIIRNEFSYIGDSAIATVGRIVMNDGYTVDTYPDKTIIDSNHIHDIGLIGKQTSALFSALTCRTTFINNILYNGPRAGININDQFCHGHNISNNLLFNWVRETQDHGPINTWDRAMYIQKVYDNEPSLIPQWAYIERNFIMNGPSGNRNLGNLFPTIDNDDGSSYYYISNNFLVYGGAKNYLGHDKIWTNNLLLHPGRWSHDPCGMIWGGENHHFTNNTCVVVSGDEPIGLDGSLEGMHCLIDWSDYENNLKYVGRTSNNKYYIDIIGDNEKKDNNDEWGFYCGGRNNNGTSTSSHFFTMKEMQQHGWETGSEVLDSKHLTIDTIIDQAKKLLNDD